VKTARDLHDDISEELSVICNILDSVAGRADLSSENRTKFRSIRNQVTKLCDLLSADIPLIAEKSKTVFSIEIRKAISEINNSLDSFGELGETLMELRSNLNFPKYFLNESGKNQKPLTPLTKREREVLLLLPRGITAKAMASELFLTEATIKSHLASIYRKFEVVNRTQAIAIGIENKLLAF
jgi:DNA-binding CsgD family transcriptional regulator